MAKMLQISCSMASLVPHGDMGTVATGILLAYSPPAPCVNYAHISHVILKAMLQLLLTVVSSCSGLKSGGGTMYWTINLCVLLSVELGSNGCSITAE